MSRPEVWLLILLAGVITFSHRASFMLLGSRLRLPAALRRSLTYIPPAVLAAIVAPAFVSGDGPTLGPLDVRLLALVGAGVVAWWRRSLLLSFVTGMTLLWVLTWLLGRG